MPAETHCKWLATDLKTASASRQSSRRIEEAPMAVALAYQEFGDGEPLVILHGLFGSARNWQSVAKRLADGYHVYSLDLRNHGRSPSNPAPDATPRR